MTLLYESVQGFTYKDEERKWEEVIKKDSETFPLHLALSMIFSANSFPVDLNRNRAIRADNKNSTDAAAVSVI